MKNRIILYRQVQYLTDSSTRVELQQDNTTFVLQRGSVISSYKPWAIFQYLFNRIRGWLGL